MFSSQSRYKPFIRPAIGLAMVAFGIVGNAPLVALGGVVLFVSGARNLVTGRSRMRGTSKTADRFGGRR
jgi:hypothetical protein